MKFYGFLGVMLITFSCSNVLASNSEVNLGENQSTSPRSNDTANGAKPNKMLKGQVQIVDLELQTLEDIAPYVKNILKGSSSLYDQAVFQPVRVITQPTMIGAGTISNIPIGTEPTGPPQPITRQQLDSAINRMKSNIELLKKNVDEFMSGEKKLNMPDDVAAQLEPQITEWVGLVNRISAQEINLKKIRQNPPYDNFEVAKAALIIQTSAKRLDKVRVSIRKLMRKESKKIAAHKAKAEIN